MQFLFDVLCVLSQARLWLLPSKKVLAGPDTAIFHWEKQRGREGTPSDERNTHEESAILWQATVMVPGSRMASRCSARGERDARGHPRPRQNLFEG